LYYPSVNRSDSPLYPGISNYDATGTINFFRIPQTLWLPTPLASDGFGTAFGTTDGLGHAEGIAGGLGSGGGGLAWTSRLGSFSVSGGKAVGDTTGSLVGTAISTVTVSTADVLVSADLVRANTSVGIIIRYIDNSNYILARLYGTLCQLVRFTAGTPNILISSAATYSSGATIRAILDGSSISLFYNNAKVGATATETQGQTSTIFGIANYGNGSNTLDNFTVYARGTNGEYNTLGTWSQP
jgi:hypothetical protein